MVSHTNGIDVPSAPFVLASNLVGLLLPTLIITRITGGTAGLRELWRRSTAVRVGPGWYAYALVVVPLTTVAVAALGFGLPRDTSVPALGAAVLFGVLLATALGSWRATSLRKSAGWVSYRRACTTGVAR